MSEKTASTPETKTPKFVEKINSMKLSAMDDEKKATVLGRIKMTAAFAAGVLTTAAVVATASYYNSFSQSDEVEVEDTEESTED